MSDDLRDRIAAVWLQHDGPYSQYKPDTDLMRLACDCGWIGETDEYTEYANHFADAVIEALGLREEHRVRSYGNWPNQPQVIYRKQRRYTSDWKNDE